MNKKTGLDKNMHAQGLAIKGICISLKVSANNEKLKKRTVTDLSLQEIFQI